MMEQAATRSKTHKKTGLSPGDTLLLQLVFARYLLLLMGLAILFWEVAEVFWMGGSGMFRSGLGVALVAALVPPMVWVVHKEGRLRQELGEGTQAITQASGLMHEVQGRSPVLVLAGLVAGRYFLLTMGVTVLLWEVAEVFWIGGDGLLGGGVRVALTAALVPAIIWAVRKEGRLRQALQARNQQVEHNTQEIRALNRMIQERFAELFSEGQAFQTAPEPSLKPLDQTTAVAGGACSPGCPGTFADSRVLHLDEEYITNGHAKSGGNGQAKASRLS